MEITLSDLREVCFVSPRAFLRRAAPSTSLQSRAGEAAARGAVEILCCISPLRARHCSVFLASLQGPSDEHPFSISVMGEMYHAEKARGDAMHFSTPYRANADYVNRVQTKGMLIRHRRILVEWMMEFSDAFKLNPEVLPLAVNYFDRFLSIENLEKKKLHLLCMVVLFVASKTAEVHHIMMNELVDATGQVYEAKDVRELEKELLAKLSWKMQPVTAYQLLKYKLHFLRTTLRVHLAEHVEAFHDFGICEYELLALPPAVFADGVISAVLEFSMQPYEVRKEVCHQLCIKQTPYLWEIQLRLMKSFFSILRQSKPHAPILHAWEERITCWEQMCVFSPLFLFRPVPFLFPSRPALSLSLSLFLSLSLSSTTSFHLSHNPHPFPFTLLTRRWNELSERPVEVPLSVDGTALRTKLDDNFHARWLKNDWLSNKEFIDVAAEWRSSAERERTAARLETERTGLLALEASGSAAGPTASPVATRGGEGAEAAEANEVATPAALTTRASTPSATVTGRDDGRLKKRVRETLRAAGQGGVGREINARAASGAQQSKRRRVARAEPASGGVGSVGASKQTHIRDHFRSQPMVAATTNNGAEALAAGGAEAAARTARARAALPTSAAMGGE